MRDCSHCFGIVVFHYLCLMIFTPNLPLGNPLPGAHARATHPVDSDFKF